MEFRSRLKALASNPRLLVPTVWVVAVIISVAASIVGVTLHDKADSRRVRQIELLKLRSRADEMKDTISDALLGSDVHTDGLRNLQYLSKDAYACLTSAENIDSDRSNLTVIHQELDRYVAQTNRVSELAASGHTAQAIFANTDLAVPAFADLVRSLQAADMQFRVKADDADSIADIGTSAILLISALTVAAIFNKLVNSQQGAIRATTEKEMLRMSESRFRSLVSNTSDVITIVDDTGIVKYISPNAITQWGYDPALVLGTCVFDDLSEEDSTRFRVMLDQALSRKGESIISEFLVPYADGTAHISETILTNMMDDPAVGGVICTSRDISQRRAFEEQLAHQAFHDALTGLSNRPLFLQRLNHTLARAARDGKCTGVLFLDIDNFKIINDSMGHEAGDYVLISVAERLQACIRPGDTAARLGGDEFTLLLEDVDKEQVMAVAERISAILRTPINVNGRDLFALGSIGIAICDNDCNTGAEELMRDADAAMYEAKGAGKAKTVVFDSSMSANAIEKLELETSLRQALANGELHVEYQPIMQLSEIRLAEVEALVRWIHPTRGIVSPATFIPVAEDLGLIVEIGRWVLEQACRDAYIWNSQAQGGTPIVVSVNVSTQELQQYDFVQRTAEILHFTKLDPRMLKLEITESGMLQNPESTIAKLNELKALGIRLAVDDFGTGYSSMSYLSNLPIDTLKIDRSFITKMSKRGDDEAIVRAIVTLAKTLNLCITSEGIETEEQLAQLQELGCNQGQGYLFAKPMKAEAMSALIETEGATLDTIKSSTCANLPMAA